MELHGRVEREGGRWGGVGGGGGKRGLGKEGEGGGVNQAPFGVDLLVLALSVRTWRQMKALHPHPAGQE